MTASKKSSDKSNFKYVSPSVAITLIILGLFVSAFFAFVGIILGMIWLFRCSKDNPRLRTLWWVLLVLLVLWFFAMMVGDYRDYSEFTKTQPK
ncbi:MAG: hypothetical protein U0524_01400 [Candidatus Saccharimonadales bacterium]